MLLVSPYLTIMVFIFLFYTTLLNAKLQNMNYIGTQKKLVLNVVLLYSLRSKLIVAALVQLLIVAVQSSIKAVTINLDRRK